MEEALILGVDPGTAVMGYALLKVNLKKSELLFMGVIKMTHLPNQNEKLKKIIDSINSIIHEYKPTILAIEAPFYGKDPQSMLKLGRAQGVVIASCLHNGLEVFEYAPRKIKQSITGRGNASKEQVAEMLKRTYLLPDEIKYYDATDALAVATCHHLQNRLNFGGEKISGWKSFIAKNEDRVIRK